MVGVHGRSGHWRGSRAQGKERLADLIVYGHVTPEDNPPLYSARETSLIAGGRPLLLVPATAPPSIGHRVAIGWNGSAEAARSVTAVLHFLRTAAAVYVLAAAATNVLATEAHGFADFLAWHDIEAEVVLLRPTRQPIASVLLDKATSLGADLLVTGAYGHSRLRELVLGSVTRYMLSHADLPVLMTH